MVAGFEQLGAPQQAFVLGGGGQNPPLAHGLPIWRGGGQTFALTPRDFSQKLNKKQWRVGLRSMLSELLRQDRIRLVQEITLPDHRTKSVKSWLDGIGEGRVLVVDTQISDELARGSANLPQVELCLAGRLNPAALVGADLVVLTAAAAEAISESLS